jgi:hypothetical protein
MRGRKPELAGDAGAVSAVIAPPARPCGELSVLPR